MNPLSLILGFLPLIAFSVLAGRVANNGIGWGALVALAIALINMAITRPRWPPKIINLISAGLFLVLTLIGFVGNRSVDGWLFDWASGLVTLTLGLLLLLTMPIMPFTEQYARERAPREYWDSPLFKKINRVLSLAWAVAILIIGLASMAVAVLDERADSASDSNLLDLLLNWVVPIGILAFMLWFTASYPDRARKAAGVAEEPQPVDPPSPSASS
jgi:signal transduction histidine kinase